MAQLHIGWSAEWPQISKQNIQLKIQKEGTFTATLECKKYLNSGHLILTTRHLFRNPISNEIIGTPTIFTDGKCFWTTSYIYLIEKGMIEIDQNFYSNMQAKNFIIPQKQELNFIQLKNQLKEFQI